MKKTAIILFFSLIQLAGFSQSTFFTRSGHIYFISHTDVIDIDADNHQVASFLNIETGKIQFAVLIKSFKFSLATAKEHFNESYMESDKHPKASFKGKILNIDSVDLSTDGVYNISVLGTITIKAVEKEIEVQAILTVDNKKINAVSEFELLISDFDVKIPKLVEKRVAELIQVKLNMNYVLYEK
ncbi:MAG: YceI family protein [Bacteroidales bacterium]|nr:YceI family protein [Bacteroidales bacterium]